MLQVEKVFFVCDRNEISLQNKINLLTKNQKIQKTMLKNFFYTKKNFENEYSKY